jgi:hypothetical protein
MHTMHTTQADNSSNAYSDAHLMAACVEALGYLRVATPHALAAIMRQVGCMHVAAWQLRVSCMVAAW